MTSHGSERDAEIVGTLGSVRSTIADACEAVGRDPQSVTLVAVTKTRPVSDVAVLARLGVFDIGESKDQEARTKLAELADLPQPPFDPAAVRWHIVGRLQSNKARTVASYAHAVHSLDRPKIARALAEARGEQRDDPLDVFVQVSLDDDPERGGVTIAKLPGLADEVAQRPQLRLRGLMAVPPMGADSDASFARLAELAASLREQHPQADAISAGMSGDYATAIRHGATHVRVGSALLGRRGP